MGSDNLSALFTWRSAVVESDLASTTRHVALTLSLHMSERGDSCWPSVRTLARETGLDERTVRGHLHVLLEGGWLERVARNGGEWSEGRPALYRATHPTAGPAPAVDEPDNPTNRGSSTRGSSTRGSSTRSTAGPDAPTAGPAPARTEDDKRTSVRTSSLAQVATERRDPTLPVGFDAFWSAYPLKVGKRTALRAWQNALKRADQHTILAGLARVAPHFKPGFTPHPTTWLNRDGWDDQVVAHELAGNLQRLEALRTPPGTTLHSEGMVSYDAPAVKYL
ncbi:MAG: helix-turn-helix domain-containing protein [Acidimicrobiales bacterium]|nr:helix-turn-helix domain-containing protein [Acidimicrobiales bacterium]